MQDLQLKSAEMMTFNYYGREFCSWIDIQVAHIHSDIEERGGPEKVQEQETEALRNLALAKEKIQEACALACRAVTRPDADC